MTSNSAASIRLTRGWALAALATLVLAPGLTAGPRDELLRVVPPNATFCMVVQDLREHTRPLQDLFGDQLPPAAFWQGLQCPPDVREFIPKAEQALRELDLQVTPRQFLTEVVGDSIVIAFRKATTGNPEDDEGMLLVWAREPKLVVRIMDQVNLYQKKSGELAAVREEGANGAKYWRRVKTNKTDQDDFYAIRGNIFCFSNAEALVRDVVNLADKAPPVDKAVPPLARELQRLAVDRAFLTVWLNPRSVDPDLVAKETSARGAEKAFLERFLQYWKATDGIALFVNAGETSAEVGLSVRVRTAQLPRAAQRFLKDTNQPSMLWQVIPQDALFAIAGRFNGAAFTEAASEFLNADTRAAIRSAVDTGLSSMAIPRPNNRAVANEIGPDWGFWIFQPAPGKGGRNWFPQVVFAVRLAAGEDGVVARAALPEAFRTLATLGCFASRGRIVQERETDGSVEIRYLSGKPLPPGLRPAFATKGDYFLLAGNPETIRQFHPPASEPKPVDEFPLLRISVKGWRDYLRTHRDDIAVYIAGLQQTKPEKATSVLNDILNQLNVPGLDRVEVVVRSQPDQASLTFRVRGDETAPTK